MRTPPHEPIPSPANDRPDLFERWYCALQSPAGRSRWTRGDLLTVLLLAAGTLPIAFQHDAGLLWDIAKSAAVVLTVAVAFLWWRQSPQAVAAVALAGLLLDGARMPVIVALYGLAKYQGRRRSVTVGCWCAAYVALTVAVPGPQQLASAREMLFSSTLAAFAVVCGLTTAAYERANLALRAERARRAEQVRTEERIRLAREMHDVLGHRVAIMAMHAGAIEFVPEGRPERLQLARTIGDTAREAMRDLRQILGALRAGEESVVLGQKLPDLDILITRVRASGLDLSYRPAPAAAADRVTAEVALTAYRTVQESLTNVVKYAPTSSVEVITTVGPDELGVRVRNTAPEVQSRRPAPVPGGGFGLMGLRERTLILGGAFTAGPTPGGGWQVHVRVPLAD
ncbi:sensor histidine kinase [Kitasatospora sp. NPDC094011]|uniref:sensor histidine kinase n=1 Tax=Kitasatospora sp. NPDC094011 TaxID=3364090 RepID=UPI00381A06A8